MRIVTDPIVDSIAFLLLEFCLPALLRLTRNFARVAYWLTISLVGLVIGQEKAGRVSGSATVAVSFYILHLAFFSFFFSSALEGYRFCPEPPT